MVCETPTEQSKGLDSSLALPKSVEQAMVAPEMAQSDSTALTQSTASSIKGEAGQESVAEQDANNPPTSYYNYYYPGYNGSFGQPNDGRDHSSMGVQADQNSIAYYMPGYNPYATGSFVGADGCQQYYTSSGYVQTPVTYGAEAVPCYAWDLNSLGNPSSGTNIPHGTVRSSPSPAHTSRPNGIKPSKLYGSANGKFSMVSSNMKSRPSSAAPNVTEPKMNKVGSYYQSNGYTNAYGSAGNFQHSSLHRHGLYGNSGGYGNNGGYGNSGGYGYYGGYGNNVAVGYKPNVRTWNGNDKFRPSRKTEYGMPTELTCGPRGHTKSQPDSSEKEPHVLTVKKDKYNLPEFQTKYEAAKFYVIKSYSEDDVHKSIKYDVWSSTANGNKKLDAAFHDAEVKANETGKNCHIFLFFSVNGSGQFVGVAEMIGKLDFDKTMDFWQLDKWSGFFPVKWHVVKDIPNTQLRHILLENNENRPVTYTRDTQEIGLKQGLEMLKIFKNYASKTSLLDDLDFYENREKALQMRRSNKSGAHQTNGFSTKNFEEQVDAERGEEDVSKPSVQTLVSLAKNLSLNSSDPKVVS